MRKSYLTYTNDGKTPYLSLQVSLSRSVGLYEMSPTNRGDKWFIFFRETVN